MLQKYYGTKVIEAKPMNLGDYNNFKSWIIPKGEDPKEEGFLVKYSDDYLSWSPKNAFDDAYQKTDALSFGHAYLAMEQGNRVARRGWNGLKMFLYYVPANAYPPTTDIAKIAFGGEDVPYGAYIAMKTAQDNVVPWTCSQTDMAAKDWYIVE